MADPIGIRKTAVMLVSLEPDYAARVMSKMEPHTVERISIEIARLEGISRDERDQVLEEFIQLHQAEQFVVMGDLATARALLEKAYPPEEVERIMASLSQSMQSQPFEFLEHADSENLITFIQDEHPQMISLILCHMGPTQAAEVLRGLPKQKQIEVIKRISRMERTDPEIVTQVEQTLQRRLSNVVTQEFKKTGGIEAVAEVLNFCDRQTEKSILETIEEDDPNLVEEIRKLLFVFEDLLLVNDKGIQSVLKEIDNQELALALKTSSDELKDKIFNNMSKRAADLVKEEMEYMGPVRLADVEMAQQTIVEVVRRLEDSGDVIISGRGGEEEIVS
ncbi:MAG: flagellar motor switch protein FliG [Planctomycetota bacterium]|nr:flagellar motor switch protein FliG [Planctomycetota bacterium]